MTEQNRQLLAIMFTDIVGYSAMTAADERKALALLDRHRELIQTLVEKFKGTWLKEIGDGTLSSFNSASDSVDCALAIQAAIIDDKELTLRIGLHTGDVVVARDDIYGDGVNVASRIEQVAKPGSVVVSDTFQNLVRGRADLCFKSLGYPELKNIGQKIEVFWSPHQIQRVEPVKKTRSQSTMMK